MKRIAPKSLIGQIALVMAAALLVAQAINFSLIYNERQRATRAQVEGPAISRFIAFVQRVASSPREERASLVPDHGRRTRFSLDQVSWVDLPVVEERLNNRLRETAAENGLALRDTRASVSDRVPAFRRRDRGRPLQMLILSAQLQDGSWVNARMITSRPNPWAAVRAAASTLLIYLIILGAMIWMARRLARPLRDLTLAAERFQGRGDTPRVEPRGPADVKRAIEAFNAMSSRVGAMLDEKDRMLGAIGHDLRTPLASLRIRAESVEPDEDRSKMIATIEEMTAMLDDTLALARSGRAMGPTRKVDVTALVDSIVEEFRGLGNDVELVSGQREAACIQPNLLRPAIRNLIENAVKYGGSARCVVRSADDALNIEIADRGPGIPEAELLRVQEPFYRLETSRSRETGGSGLGLTLARAAAQAHGGSLSLENGKQGGLVARISIPRRAASN
jgi:signal transduction histidine kinase